MELFCESFVLMVVCRENTTVSRCLLFDLHQKRKNEEFSTVFSNVVRCETRLRGKEWSNINQKFNKNQFKFNTGSHELHEKWSKSFSTKLTCVREKAIIRCARKSADWHFGTKKIMPIGTLKNDRHFLSRAG